MDLSLSLISTYPNVAFSLTLFILDSRRKVGVYYENSELFFSFNFRRTAYHSRRHYQWLHESRHRPDQPLFQERRDNRSHLFCFLYCKIDPFSGINQSGTVNHMGIFRTVLVFIKVAARPVGTTIAGTGRAVAS